MNRPVVGLVALGAVLAAVLLVTLMREQRRERAEPVGDSVAIADESVALAPAPVAEAPAGTPETAAVTTQAPTPSQREAVPDPMADELARAHWVEGHVVFPPNTPFDEEVFVVARGKEFFSDGEFRRARVERDGRFRVAFAEGSKDGSLALEANYLYLEENVRWTRGKGTDEPVVLEPRLGARLTGRLVPPADMTPTSVGGEVELHLIRSSAEGSSSWRRGERDVERDLAFDFGGLPEDYGYRVMYEGNELVGAAVEAEAEAGRTAHVEIELEPGAVVSGRVVDESGAGVEGIRVGATVDPRPAGTRARYDKSDSDGAFRIAALHGGGTTLIVQTNGYVDLRVTLGTLETGDIREGVELVLRRGNSIAGRVLWPDGTPAEASLQAVSGASPPYNGKDRATSAADGTFRITGLGAGPYTIRATAKRMEEIPEWSEMLGRKRIRKKAAWLKASAEHVAVNTSDLVLVLSAGLELEGRAAIRDVGPRAPARNR